MSRAPKPAPPATTPLLELLITTIGTFSTPAAIAQMIDRHQVDHRGHCRACRHVGPCTTAQALRRLRVG